MAAVAICDLGVLPLELAKIVIDYAPIWSIDEDVDRFMALCDLATNRTFVIYPSTNWSCCAVILVATGSYGAVLHTRLIDGVCTIEQAVLAKDRVGYLRSGDLNRFFSSYDYPQELLSSIGEGIIALLDATSIDERRAVCSKYMIDTDWKLNTNDR
jgi:hypothetical protein